MSRDIIDVRMQQILQLKHGDSIMKQELNNAVPETSNGEMMPTAAQWSNTVQQLFIEHLTRGDMCPIYGPCVI